MKLEFACHVAQGIRPYNDDRCLILGRVFAEDAVTGETDTPILAAVCDGCGGYAGGGTAAEIILQTLNTFPAEDLADPAKLSRALEEANRAVFDRKAREPRLRNMCATIAGCLFTEESTLIFHAGDSRVYRYDGYGLTRMTMDHSVVQEMVAMGRITEEEARVSPSRNVITRCMGAECLSPDIYVSRSPIAPGEVYLICSDGLWDYLEETQIGLLLTNAAEDPLHTARELVSLALEQGGNDNVTVCLCVCPGAAPREESSPFILD